MKTGAAKEKKIHVIFEVSILIKGFYAILEILGGLIVYIITTPYVMNQVLTWAEADVSNDTQDVFMSYLLTLGNNFSVSTQHFIAFYLISHGAIKLFLVVNLLKKKVWAYPLSIVTFGLFIAYQLSRFYFTHSPWLILLTFFDIAVILLIMHEYPKVKLARALTT